MEGGGSVRLGAFVLDDEFALETFEDFGRAKQRGEKISYVVACLAKQYNMSERSVYDIVKRLGNDCKAASL